MSGSEILNLSRHRVAPGQVLLIDADDTLWENNIYFEEAIARFIAYLDHRQHSSEQVREHLNRAERATIAAHGYGLKSFRASLTRCLEDLLTTKASAEQHRRIAEFVSHIGDHALELLPNVADTVRTLAERHTLMLITKGDREEQLYKLAQSGLERLFKAAEVLPEKHEAAYRDLTARYAVSRDRTWMIGNSPKSDVNPALAAGLNAVLIPHAHTWILEHESVCTAPTGQVLLQLNRFAELAEVF